MITYGGRKRLVIIFAFMAVSLTLLCVRLGFIMLVNGEEYQSMAYEQQTRDRLIAPKRGDILDRNGVPIAVSRSTNAVSVINAQVEDEEKTAELLSEVLGEDYEKTLKAVKERVALKRIKTKVDRETAAELRKLNIAGVMIDEDTDRFYPCSEMAASVIGFVGRDNQGIIGLESKYETYLKGEAGKLLTLTDLKGRRVSTSEERVEPVNGNNLVTTMDVVIQQYAEQEIQAAVEAKGAKNGLIIVMNPQNGELYAMADYPSFDLNEPFKINDAELEKVWTELSAEKRNDCLNKMWRNRAINDTYEPGSTFKIITSSAGLEEGVITPETTFDCNGALTVGGVRIKCWRYPRTHGHQTFRQGICNSCNGVFAKVHHI